MSESEKMDNNSWNNPIWGSVCWPIFTACGVYQDSIWMAIFGAFWAGISIDRWLTKEGKNYAN